MKFTPEQSEVLERNITNWNTLVDHDYFPKLPHTEMVALMNVYQQAFKRGPVNLHCNGCVKDMLKSLFNNYTQKPARSKKGKFKEDDKSTPKKDESKKSGIKKKTKKKK